MRARMVSTCTRHDITSPSEGCLLESIFESSDLRFKLVQLCHDVVVRHTLVARRIWKMQSSRFTCHPHAGLYERFSFHYTFVCKGTSVVSIHRDLLLLGHQTLVMSF